MDDPTPNPDKNITPIQPALPPVEPATVKEIGGYKGAEPTRFGDWEHKGRCSDF